MFLKILQYSQENTSARVSSFVGIRPATLLKKKTLVQAFSGEFCEIFKNIFFTEHHRTTASVDCLRPHNWQIFENVYVLSRLFNIVTVSMFFYISL